MGLMANFRPSISLIILLLTHNSVIQSAQMDPTTMEPTTMERKTDSPEIKQPETEPPTKPPNKYSYFNEACGSAAEAKECDAEANLKCIEDSRCECEDLAEINKYDSKRCIHELTFKLWGEDCNLKENEHCNIADYLACSETEKVCRCVVDKYVTFDKETQKCLLNETGKYGFGGGETIISSSVIISLLLVTLINPYIVYFIDTRVQ